MFSDAGRRESSLAKGDYADRCILKGKMCERHTRVAAEHKTCECHSKGHARNLAP